MFDFKKNLLVLAACSSLLLTFALPQISPVTGLAQADSSKASIGISPARFDDKNMQTKSWFIEKLSPGQKVEREYTVYNYLDQDHKINIHANDAVQTTDGSFTFLQNQEDSQLVGKWVAAEDKVVSVSAKSQKNFKMNLSVPATAANGEYAGVISAQLPGNTNLDGITIESRIGARIYVTVGDNLKLASEPSNFGFYTKPTEQIKVAPRANNIGLSFDLKNTGNIFTKAFAVIKVQTPTGDLTKTFDKDLGPGDAVLSNLVNLDKSWELGKYTASIEFSSQPIIAANKTGIQDQSAVRTLSTEFEMTQELLDALKANFSGDQNAGQDVTTTSKNQVFIVQPNQTQLTTDEDNQLYTWLTIGVGVGWGIVLAAGIGWGIMYLRKRRSQTQDPPDT
jgi:Bacterial protein of unknown function (DUF916)